MAILTDYLALGYLGLETGPALVPAGTPYIERLPTEVVEVERTGTPVVPAPSTSEAQLVGPYPLFHTDEPASTGPGLFESVAGAAVLTYSPDLGDKVPMYAVGIGAVVSHNRKNIGVHR
jgi:hypothetical protein